MANGTYTAPERVVRDGVVICFKGEVMTWAEAERRGLARFGEPPVIEGLEPAPAPEPEQEPAPEPEQEPAPEPEQKPEAEAADVDTLAAELAAANKLDELRAMADELGAAYPKDATKAVVAKAIAEARAAKAAE